MTAAAAPEVYLAKDMVHDLEKKNFNKNVPYGKEEQFCNDPTTGNIVYDYGSTLPSAAPTTATTAAPVTSSAPTTVKTSAPATTRSN